MSLGQKVLQKLMSDVPQEKYYGNPFKYLIERWEDKSGPEFYGIGKGFDLAHAALSAYPHALYSFSQLREDIEIAKIAYDIWINILVATGPARHTEIIKRIEDFHFILPSVERLYTMGLSEREIKDSYYKEAYDLGGPHPQTSGTFHTVLKAMDTISREALAEHDHVLESQLNTDMKEHAGRHGPGPEDEIGAGRMSLDDNQDLVDGVDGPDRMEEGAK